MSESTYTLFSLEPKLAPDASGVPRCNFLTLPTRTPSLSITRPDEHCTIRPKCYDRELRMSEYLFKTVYFPKERVRIGKSVRTNISFPARPREGASSEFITYIKALTSREFRMALGDPILEDLELKATQENRSLSNLCISALKASFDSGARSSNFISVQGSLPFDDSDEKDVSNGDILTETSLGLTFQDNFRQGVYGWYPYVEGFSATYIRDALLRDGKKPKTVYDPFGGSGTTQLASSLLGVQSFYSELNPFMAFVAETKVVSSNWARNNLKLFEGIAQNFLLRLKDEASFNSVPVDLASYHAAFPERDFFEPQHIRDLLAALKLAEDISADFTHAKKILTLACASNAVACSNMTRRADLRRRRPDEYKNRIVNVPRMIADTVERMVEDVKSLPLSMAGTTVISSDAKVIPDDYINAFELVLTSPPYLNGTNYFRNTKIELWLLSFITSEQDLRYFRDLCVTGGINDVSKKENYKKFGAVEAIAEKLDVAAKDKRIATMVRHYFSDMFEVLKNIHKSLIPGAKCLMDIGDSKFYGVHVPTDKLLVEVAKCAGLNFVHSHLLARRMSRDKSELVQVELVFEKPMQTAERPDYDGVDRTLLQKIEEFQRTLPYKSAPYTKKNWGHPLHSLCSYQGKLKPSLAYWLTNTFVPEGGVLLDPIGGVGTIPFEGAYSGMRVISNDKSPFAAIIARAKLNPPSLLAVEETLLRLTEKMAGVDLTSEDYQAAEFGLNASVKDYYHEKTLEEILKLRKIFLLEDPEHRDHAANFTWASLLHILHGNRPYALSRTSHPITPFAPTGPTEYKNTIEKILERAKRSLCVPLPSEFIPGLGIHGDFRDLSSKITEKIDTIITSPPFYGMRFDRPNWLRLWFCGWTERHFKEESLQFLERQQVKDITVYREFFEMCHATLKKNGLLIIHLGSGGTRDMVSELKELGRESFSYAGEILENVQAVETHGIKDRGLTKSHSLLFFTPRER
jgi:DNA modification methylase